jgi:hypothetical protein
MKPEIWGPHFWYVLHTISFNYPAEPTEYHKTSYREFFTTLKDVLPCEKCRRHYQTYLSTYPISPHLDTRASLIKWVIQVHNFVNEQLGKRIYTVAEVLNIYKNLKPNSPFKEEEVKNYVNPIYKTRYKIWTIIIIFLILAIWIKYYYCKYHYN